MFKFTVQKFPLNSSFVYHTLGTTNLLEPVASDSSNCAREFLSYIQKSGPIIDKNLSKAISKLIHEYIPTDKASERSMRKMVQCINLNLTLEDAKELFPELMDEVFTYQGELEGNEWKNEVTGRQLYEEICQKIQHIDL